MSLQHELAFTQTCTCKRQPMHNKCIALYIACMAVSYMTYGAAASFHTILHSSHSNNALQLTQCAHISYTLTCWYHHHSHNHYYHHNDPVKHIEHTAHRIAMCSIPDQIADIHISYQVHICECIHTNKETYKHTQCHVRIQTPQQTPWQATHTHIKTRRCTRMYTWQNHTHNATHTKTQTKFNI
jgi:hypothetical protein